jgi:hypothetical protein
VPVALQKPLLESVLTPPGIESIFHPQKLDEVGIRTGWLEAESCQAHYLDGAGDSGLSHKAGRRPRMTQILGGVWGTRGKRSNSRSIGAGLRRGRPARLFVSWPELAPAPGQGR